MTVKKNTNETSEERLAKAKRDARGRAPQTHASPSAGREVSPGVSEPRQLLAKKWVDQLTGREPFYLIIVLDLMALRVGGRMPQAVTGVLVGGLLAVALASLGLLSSAPRRGNLL